MNRVLERSVKLVPSISFVPPLPEDVLDATSTVVPKEQAPFATRIAEEESDEEQLVRHFSGKDKGPEIQETSRPGMKRAPNFPSLRWFYDLTPPSLECWFRKELQDLSYELD
ncbi:hypothetical protein ACOSP7_022444 [Xanthoceras sorbifolium]